MSGHGHNVVGSNSDAEVCQEFKRYTQDAGMAKEDTKVHIVLALNQDTLNRLATYVTIGVGDKIACLETIQDRLHHVPYV